MLNLISELFQIKKLFRTKNNKDNKLEETLRHQGKLDKDKDLSQDNLNKVNKEVKIHNSKDKDLNIKVRIKDHQIKEHKIKDNKVNKLEELQQEKVRNEYKVKKSN